MAGRPFKEKIKDAFSSLLGCLGGGLVVLLFLLVTAAQFRSCFVAGGDGQDAGPNVMAADSGNPRHARLMVPLLATWGASGQYGSPEMFVVESPELNAASLGRGQFLVWEGVLELDSEEIASILAHEVAHDVLKHSRKSAEARDLTNFFAEILALWSGSDPSAEEVLKDWVGKAATSKYSQAQELAADQLAADLLAEAGFNSPKTVLADALSNLLQAHGDTGGGWFDSHPAISERIRLLREAPTVAGGPPVAPEALGAEEGRFFSEGDENEDALSAWESLAEAGDPEAQYELAGLYLQGLGVPKNPSEAARWLEKAALQGHAEAAFELAYAFEQGIGVAASHRQALAWYSRGAELGHHDAQYNLGIALLHGEPVQRDEGLSWIRRAAEAGHARSRYDLGMRYFLGDQLTKDNSLAFYWLLLTEKVATGELLEWASRRKGEVAREMPSDLIREVEALVKTESES